jgi:hypothetical protein
MLQPSHQQPTIASDAVTTEVLSRGVEHLQLIENGRACSGARRLVRHEAWPTAQSLQTCRGNSSCSLCAGNALRSCAILSTTSRQRALHARKSGVESRTIAKQFAKRSRNMTQRCSTGPWWPPVARKATVHEESTSISHATEHLWQTLTPTKRVQRACPAR